MALKKKLPHGVTARKTKSRKSRRTTTKNTTKIKDKVSEVMHEYKEGKLHSRSKKGPVVRSRKQAVAIALNEAGVSRASKKKK